MTGVDRLEPAAVAPTKAGLTDMIGASVRQRLHVAGNAPSRRSRRPGSLMIGEWVRPRPYPAVSAPN
jgi:hypothetical protein